MRLKLLVLLGVVVTEPRRCEEPALERSIQSNRDGITKHDGPLDASGIGGATQQHSSQYPRKWHAPARYRSGEGHPEREGDIRP